MAALKLFSVTVVSGAEVEAALLVVGVVASQVVNNTRSSFKQLFSYHLLLFYLIVMPFVVVTNLSRCCINYSMLIQEVYKSSILKAYNMLLLFVLK